VGRQLHPQLRAGHLQEVPASLTMWRVRWHSGQRYFTRMTMRWTTRNGVHHKHIYRYSKAGGTELSWH